jgi:hypothetical protein
MTRSINTPTMPRTKKINYVYCTDSNINIKIKYSHSFFNLMVLCGSFKYLKYFFHDITFISLFATLTHILSNLVQMRRALLPLQI